MKAKRFLSVLMAVMLLVSCFAISASAVTATETQGNTNAIKDTSANVSLTINVYNGTTGAAGTGVTLEDTSSLGSPVAGVWFDVYKTTDTGAKGDLLAQVKTNSSGVAKVQNANGASGDESIVNKTTAEMPQGRYIVSLSIDKTQPSYMTGTIAEFTVDLPMTDPEDNGWIYDVNVYPKVQTTTGTPTLTKQVAQGTVGTTGQTFSNSAYIDAYSNSGAGNVATWKITSNLPADISNYTSLVITDIIDQRLTLQKVADKIIVKNGDTALVNTTDYNWSTGTDTTTGVSLDKLTVTLTAAGIAKLTANGTLTVEIETSINTAKNYAVGYKIANDATLTYTNGMGENGTVESDDKTDNDPVDPTDPDGNKNPADPANDPWILTGQLKVKKTDSSGNLITNSTETERAQFTLYTSNPTNTQTADSSTVYDTVTVGADGTYTFTGIKPGTYYLVETRAPKSYELNGNVYTVTIGDGTVAYTYNTEGDNSSGIKSVTTNAIQEQSVVNIQSTTLPLTGGTGVLLFVAAGIALLGVGAVVFFKKDKKTKA